MQFVLRLLMYFLSRVDMRVQATTFAARAASSSSSAYQPNTQRTGFTKRRQGLICCCRALLYVSVVGVSGYCCCVLTRHCRHSGMRYSALLNSTIVVLGGSGSRVLARYRQRWLR